MAHPAPTLRRPADTGSISALAAWLDGLITARGLAPGDPFLTTEEAARLLKVRRDSANRALQVLVQRGRIERRQRVGATVAQAGLAPPALARVHVLVQEEHGRGGGSYPAATQVGLHSVFPGSEVELHVVPGAGARPLLEPLVRDALARPRPEGLVLVRCAYPTQRFAQDCGLPAVVHGSTYSGIELSSLDVDGEQLGRLQAGALLAAGGERIVVLRRDRALPGDRRFLTGLREAAAREGLACDELDELELPPFAELVSAELASLFREDARLGLVATTLELADAARDAASAAGRVLGADLWLHANSPDRLSGARPYRCAVPVLDGAAQGVALGRLLARTLADPAAQSERCTIRSELVDPTEAP